MQQEKKARILSANAAQASVTTAAAAAVAAAAPVVLRAGRGSQSFQGGQYQLPKLSHGSYLHPLVWGMRSGDGGAETHLEGEREWAADKGGARIPDRKQGGATAHGIRKEEKNREGPGD